MPALQLHTLRLPATLENLDRAREFVLGHVPAALEPKVDLVLEELYLNVVNHAYAGAATGAAGWGEVEIACGVEPDPASPRFHLCLKDWGPPFDPLALPDPDLDAGLDDREPGGLGVHLVKRMASTLEYVRTADAANRLHCCFVFKA